MLEFNKIYCMDCFEGLKQIDDNSINAIITDPPYYIQALKEDLKVESLRKSSKNNIFHADWDSIWKNKDEFLDWMYRLLTEYNRILKPKSQVYMFMSYHHVPDLILYIRKHFKFYKPLIWYKPDTMGVFPNQYGCNYEMILWFRKDDGQDGTFINHIGCGQRDVFVKNSTLNSYRKECGYHPTPKPIGIIRRLIKNCTNEGDLVLDSFLGSGTVAVACKQIKRNFIGFEINSEYIKTSNKRLCQNTLLTLDDFKEDENMENEIKTDIKVGDELDEIFPEMKRMEVGVNPAAKEKTQLERIKEFMVGKESVKVADVVNNLQINENSVRGLFNICVKKNIEFKRVGKGEYSLLNFKLD